MASDLTKIVDVAKYRLAFQVDDVSQQACQYRRNQSFKQN